MPKWTEVDHPYLRYGAGSEPFVVSRDGFIAWDLRKTAQAGDSDRQAHFARELTRLSQALDDLIMPVFVSFGGERRRMDKGCVGHAVARGFIRRPTDGPEGIVDAVEIRPVDATGDRP